MPRATLVDMDIYDPSDVIGDTSIYDEAVYKIESDQEVYNEETGDNPVVEATGTANNDDEGPVTLKSSSYKKVNTSGHDESVYKIKSDPEVYTINDPAVEITRAAEGSKDEPARVNPSRSKLPDLI